MSSDTARQYFIIHIQTKDNKKVHGGIKISTTRINVVGKFLLVPMMETAYSKILPTMLLADKSIKINHELKKKNFFQAKLFWVSFERGR